MKNILKFLLETEKLKKMPRTGWRLMGIKNPETIAEHSFRVAILTWALAKIKKIDTKRAIKIALFHDLCEVYAGDMTPFGYYLQLPKNKKEKKTVLMRWVRLSQKEKIKRAKKKFEKEKRSLMKLIRDLSPWTKRDIFSAWIDYEKRISKEGRFVKQVDRIETLIQSIEYFGTKKEIGGTSWWEGTEEIVEDPLLLEFLGAIQQRFYHKKRDKKDKLPNVLDFVLKIGKLKKIQRRCWTIRKVKNPETIASHAFFLSLMAFLVNSEKKLKINEERMLKMALTSFLPTVYSSQRTPYDYLLRNKSESEKEKILKRWFRLSRKEKKERFLREYRREKKALEKLTSDLPLYLRSEIIRLWEEFKTKSSPEGYFLGQMEVLVVLLQALQYWERNKKFPIETFWEWAFESSDNPVNFEFMDICKKKFYK